MTVAYPNKDISAKDDNSNYSIGYKDKDGKFRAVSDVYGLPIKGAVNENKIPNLSNVPGQVVTVTDIFDISLGNGDIVTAEGNMNGSRYTKISQSPFNANTETSLTTKESFRIPFIVDSGITISQRLVGVECAYGVIGVDSSGAIESLTPPADLSISGSITVATNVWTINFPSDHGLVPNDRICLIGNTDSRLNV